MPGVVGGKQSPVLISGPKEPRRPSTWGFDVVYTKQMSGERLKVTFNLFLLNKFDITNKQNWTNMILRTIVCCFPQRDCINFC